MKVGIKVSEIVLALLSSVAGIGVFWWWQKTVPLIIAGKFLTYTQFIPPAVGLIILATLFSLATLFIKNPWIMYASLLIGVGAPYFLMPISYQVAAGFAATQALTALAIRRIRTEYDLTLSFVAARILKTGLPLYFTITSVIVSFFYFTTITEDMAITSLFPRSVFALAVKTLSGPLQTLTGLPAIQSDTTVDEFLVGIVREQFSSHGEKIPRINSQEFTALLGKQREQFRAKFGITFAGKERVVDLLYNAIITRFQELLGPYRLYVPFVSTFAFFFAFKAFTFPLYFLTLFFIFLLIKLLVAAKILKREIRHIDVEKLTL